MDGAQQAWHTFLQTGSVQDYLRFCALNRAAEQTGSLEREATASHAHQHRGFDHQSDGYR